MKKFLVTGLTVLYISSCNKSTSEPKFAVDPNSVIKPAIETKKTLIVVFESETCQYCDKLNRDLKDLKLRESLAKNNVDVAIVDVNGKRMVTDPESKKVMEERSLASVYRVTGYPTIAVFLPEKDYQLFGVIPGYMPKEYFVRLTNYIGTKCYEKVRSFQEYIEKGEQC